MRVASKEWESADFGPEPLPLDLRAYESGPDAVRWAQRPGYPMSALTWPAAASFAHHCGFAYLEKI